MSPSADSSPKIGVSIEYYSSSSENGIDCFIGNESTTIGIVHSPINSSSVIENRNSPISAIIRKNIPYLVEYHSSSDQEGILSKNPNFLSSSLMQIIYLKHYFSSSETNAKSMSGLHKRSDVDSNVSYFRQCRHLTGIICGLNTLKLHILFLTNQLSRQLFGRNSRFILLLFLLTLFNLVAVTTSISVEKMQRPKLKNASTSPNSLYGNSSHYENIPEKAVELNFTDPNSDSNDNDIELSDDLADLFPIQESEAEDTHDFDNNGVNAILINQQETMRLKMSDLHQTCLHDLVLSGQANEFRDGNYVNFTEMVHVNHTNSLYAVAQDAKLVKLNGRSLALQKSHTVPARSQNSPYCDTALGCKQFKEINLISVMPREEFVWYCALHYERYANGRTVLQQSITGCAVPQPDNLAENLLQWDNPYYTSFDPDHAPVVVNTQEPFSYFASLSSGYLRIMRTNMPDWNGEINWNGALFSPSRGVFIQEPANILLGFETDNAVYFVLRERSSQQDAFCRGVGNVYAAGSTSGSTHLFKATNNAVARVVRVCKGDRGGLPRISASTFGTLAKADLVCQSESLVDGHLRSKFTFPYPQSAYWDSNSERLYATFSNDKAGPDGSAVCIFDKMGLEKAFDGPVLTSFTSAGNPRPEPRQNPFPNICLRFSMGNLTVSEISAGQIGASYLRRHEPILPIFGYAVSMISGDIWRRIVGYKFTVSNGNQPTTSTTILWLASKQNLVQIAFYERAPGLDLNVATVSSSLSATCPLRKISIRERYSGERSFFNQLFFKDRIQLDDRSPVDKKLFDIFSEKSHTGRSLYSPTEEINNLLLQENSIYVSTTESVYRLPRESCGLHINETSCLGSGDPHCGWQREIGRCIMLQSGVDVRMVKTMFSDADSPKFQCALFRKRTVNLGNGWSDWKPCSILKDLVIPDKISNEEVGKHACLCRICLRSDLCHLGEQEVSRCNEPNIAPLRSDGMRKVTSTDNQNLHYAFIGGVFFVLGMITTGLITCLLYRVHLRRRKCISRKRHREKIMREFITRSTIENRLRTALLGNSLLSLHRSYVDMPQHMANYPADATSRIPPIFPQSQTTHLSSSNDDDTANQYDRLEDGSLS